MTLLLARNFSETQQRILTVLSDEGITMIVSSSCRGCPTSRSSSRRVEVTMGLRSEPRDRRAWLRRGDEQGGNEVSNSKLRLLEISTHLAPPVIRARTAAEVVNRTSLEGELAS